MVFMEKDKGSGRDQGALERKRHGKLKRRRDRP